MYKVFINDKWIFFGDFQKNQFSENEEYEVLKCSKDIIYNFSVMIKTGSFDKNIILDQASDIQKSFDFFLKQFIVLEAAGGIVYHSNKSFLMIKRFGIWDFPKGKIEENEKADYSALREVNEETGVDSLKIIRVLPIIYHTYRFGREWVVKKTHWFLMHTDFNGILIPQTEEDIQEVKWVSYLELPEYLSNTYASLNELVIKANILGKLDT